MSEYPSVRLTACGSHLSASAQARDEDWLHHSKQSQQAFLEFAMAGRAATEIVFEAEGITAGATDDFKKATSLAEAMVTHYGMSDTLGMPFHPQAKCPYSMGVINP